MLTNPEASGMEAKIKPFTPQGQQDIAAVKKYKQSAAMLRVVNSQELAVQGIAVASQLLNSRLDQVLTNPGVLGVG